MTEDEADDYEAWKTQRDLAAVRHRMQMQHQRDALDGVVQTLAKKLGLRVRVQYSGDYAWHVDGCLLPPRADFEIDEALFMSCERPALLDMIICEMNNLQSNIFDATAKKMSELDVNGRKYGLSRDERHTLHEMFSDCERGLWGQYMPLDDPRHKALGEKRDRYLALVERLTR